VAQNLRGGRRVFEAYGDGMILPGIFEDVAAVCGENDIDAGPLRGGGEGTGLVTGGRCDEQYGRHKSARRGINRQCDAIAKCLFQPGDGAVFIVIVRGSAHSHRSDHLAIDDDRQAAGIGEEPVVKG